ncbi:hypothetical protein [Streptomyces sp. NPDC093111]|uniref:hypothetical protein n=1 Tax=Streptomyces sp. NPDC093111 TaxID=3154978 RepID=UPI003421C3AB
MTGTRNLPGIHVTEHAPCWGDEDFAVADDRFKSSADLIKLCSPVLYVCAGCPFRAACIRQVRPAKTEFSGICGGRIWNNGEIVCTHPDAEPAELLAPVIRKAACGKAAGVRAHRKAAEQLCLRCQEFDTDADQLELPTSD